ncbi:Crp/Fnr family transcriptional regulator [Myxococcota bacterium]
MKPLSKREHAKALQAFANYPLLEHASDSSIKSLIGAAVFQRCQKGERLLSEAQLATDVCFLLEGVARIFHQSDDGLEFTPKIMAAPNHFGDLELLARRSTNGQSVEVLSEALVARVPWGTIKEILLEDHQLCVDWLSGIASQFVYTIDADRHNVFLGLGGRVANVLLSYGHVFGQQTPDGLELDVEMSRDGLARQVGSVKRAVLRVVQAFTKRGWIDTRGPRLLIKDQRALQGQTLSRRLGLGHRTIPLSLIESA